MLFLSGGADSVGVVGTTARSLKNTARFIPIAIVSASKATIRAALPVRVEFCKPVALFILSDSACNRLAARNRQTVVDLVILLGPCVYRNARGRVPQQSKRPPEEV